MRSLIVQEFERNKISVIRSIFIVLLTNQLGRYYSDDFYFLMIYVNSLDHRRFHETPIYLLTILKMRRSTKNSKRPVHKCTTLSKIASGNSRKKTKAAPKETLVKKKVHTVKKTKEILSKKKTPSKKRNQRI